MLRDGSFRKSISGLVAEYIVAIDVTGLNSRLMQACVYPGAGTRG